MHSLQQDEFMSREPIIFHFRSIVVSANTRKMRWRVLATLPADERYPLRVKKAPVSTSQTSSQILVTPPTHIAVKRTTTHQIVPPFS